jgi:virginiamycin A acetyltransferase
MKNKVRLFLWKLLGIRYYRFLKGQKKTYLHDASHTSIGFKTYHNGAFVWRWNSKATLKIGAYCSIANDVNFVLDAGFHTDSAVTSFPHLNHMSDKSVLVENKTIPEFQKHIESEKHSIAIGNDVWIGIGATILPGVKIGNGATILASAVVSDDVPHYAVAGGVPAKVVIFKHDEQIIQKMNRIAWWNWTPEKVEENVADFYLPIADFIKKWDVPNAE